MELNLSQDQLVDCKGTQSKSRSTTLNSSQHETSDGGTKNRKMAIAIGLSLACVCLLIIGSGFLLWWKRRKAQQDINEHESATSNFISKNLVGKVYKG
ncbi:unnamed protein product [Arabis nemorensis]|uniref:Uncharacterized protein n=1 Tax=Arabis nemorensis TaxID=586526 RepID=A0A565BRQ3_9BRAS|nr:unnamed protein product [Arabis nemorensis]